MSSTHLRPPAHGNGNSTHALSELERICTQLSLPSTTSNLARAILSATHSDSTSDSYYAACAVYIAATSDRPRTPLRLSALFNAAGGQLLITDFFARAKLVAADASTRLARPLPHDPSTAVHDTHLAFMVAADVWRKLTEILEKGLLHCAKHTPRMAWLFFLLCKGHLTATTSPLAIFHAYHLLLACLVEAGLVRGEKPIEMLCSVTGAVSTEVERSRTTLRTALPPNVLMRLPLHLAPDPAEVCTFLDSQYSSLIENTAQSQAVDERVFVEAPHLLVSPKTPPTTPPAHVEQGLTSGRADMDGFVTPTRSPGQKRKLIDAPAFHTPRTRADLVREKMSPIPRPSRFSRYIGAGRGADALDALAAVASSTPHSPAVSNTNSSKLSTPTTPMSTGCIAVSWLHKIADSRPETADEDNCFSCPAAELQTTEALKSIISDQQRWASIVSSIRGLSDRLSAEIPELTGPERKQEAMAIFFASMEHILLRETSRLKEKPKWIMENLIKAASVHKSLLLCAWEVTTAAYGRRDLAIFKAAIRSFEIPPLDVIKAIESFARLPDMPRSLASHIVVCGNRVLESMAWHSNSKLVADLTGRALEKVSAQKFSATSKENHPNGHPGQTMLAAKKPDEVMSGHPVREFSLEFFYKKMLALASERAQELLIRLGMDSIAEPVWTSIKYAVWEKWHLMVDRHLDQVIMCCIYGVAKVQRYELKFREIIQVYQTMSHVREPSFTRQIPGVFRDVALDPHLEFLPTEDPETLRLSRPSDSKGLRGDIIKLYNQVFIHAMKKHILQFQAQISPPGSSMMPVRHLTGTGSSSTDSPQISASAGVCTSDDIFSGNVVREHCIQATPRTRDILNEKVMSSPMRALRPHASPRRIGRVTVSPMSPGGRSLVAIRQSPARRGAGKMGGSMTPGTRKLYAFGESPVRSLEGINRSVAPESESKDHRVAGLRPVPLTFEGKGVGKRSASMRRRVADALVRKPGRNDPESLRISSASEGNYPNTKEMRVMVRSQVSEGHSIAASDDQATSGVQLQSPAS